MLTVSNLNPPLFLSVFQVLDFWRNSAIITGNAFYKIRLHDFLTPAVGRIPHWVLCYRASTHSWASTTFHSRCDGKRDTVTIIKKGEYVFGGYTDIPWGKYNIPCLFSLYQSKSIYISLEIGMLVLLVHSYAVIIGLIKKETAVKELFFTDNLRTIQNGKNASKKLYRFPRRMVHDLSYLKDEQRLFHSFFPKKVAKSFVSSLHNHCL